MTQSTSAVLPGPTLNGRRRRTDLMPTIPAHRDGGGGVSSATSPSSRASSTRGSVSRTTGMSASLPRLDQLGSRQRKRIPIPEMSALEPLHETSPPTATTTTTIRSSKNPWSKARMLDGKSPATGAQSMSKSMSHLATVSSSSLTAAAANGKQHRVSVKSTLNKCATSASTGQLVSDEGRKVKRKTTNDVSSSSSPPINQPRMTRAERLRHKAREVRKEGNGDKNGGLFTVTHTHTRK